MFSPQQRKRGTAASYAADEGGALSHEHWREEDGENENEKKKLASYRPCLVLAGLIILLVFLFSSGSLSLASVSRSSLSALEIKRRAEEEVKLYLEGEDFKLMVEGLNFLS